MLAPKCATYNGRSTFANPKYLKIAQSEKPHLYEIPYDTSDPANRFCPNGEETVTLEKEKMHDDLEYVKSLEKEIDELESEKADFSNIYDLLLEECVSKDVTCSYLHSLSELNAHTELQCMYLHKVKECECLAQKLSKQTESVNNEAPFLNVSKDFERINQARSSSKMSDHNIQSSHHNDKRRLSKMSLHASFLKDKRLRNVEPKNIKRQMADSAWIESMQEELNTKGYASDEGNDFEESFAPVCSLNSSDSVANAAHKSFKLSDGRKNAFLNGPTEGGGYLLSPEGHDPIIHKKSTF
ncbi:hypothetical protein Tco_0159084 [Tanacetum coccineum]